MTQDKEENLLDSVALVAASARCLSVKCMAHTAKDARIVRENGYN